MIRFLIPPVKITKDRVQGDSEITMASSPTKLCQSPTQEMKTDFTTGLTSVDEFLRVSSRSLSFCLIAALTLSYLAFTLSTSSLRSEASSSVHMSWSSAPVTFRSSTRGLWSSMIRAVVCKLVNIC